jgi:hypothetical protein
MRRLSLLALPFLAAFAMIFGLYNLYTAFQLLRSGYVVRGALVGVFGLVGVGLAAAIWVARRRVLGPRSAGAPNASGERPSA